jgi:glycine cleavage system H protein
MKEIDELILPDDCRYSEDHEWAKTEGDNVRVGLSDYAQDQLGDIVYLELPQVGDTFEKNQEFGTVESVKAVSEMLMPIGGEVVDVNSSIEESPNLVNESPYKEGWLIEIKPSDSGEMETLLTNDEYLSFLENEAE